MTFSEPQYKTLKLEKDPKSFLKEYQFHVNSISLYANIEIEAADFETEAHQVSQGIFDILAKHIEEENEQSVYNRFEESLKEINFFLNDLKAQQETATFGKIHAILAVLEENTLHVTKTGLAESYLLRKGKVIEISEGLYSSKASDEKNYFLNIASGDLESGDKIIFSSKRLLKFISIGDLTSAFLTSNIDEAFEDIKNHLLYEDTGNMLISGCMMQNDMPNSSVIHLEEEEQVLQEYKPSSGSILGNMGQKAFVFVKNFIQNFPQNLKNPVKRKNYIISTSIVLAAVLFISITLQANNKTNNEKLGQYSTVLQVARDRLSDASRERLYDNKQASLHLQESKKKALEVLESGVYYNDAKTLLQNIEKEEELLDKRVKVDNPIMLVDLARKDSTIDAIGLIYFKDAFYALTTDSLLGPIIDSSPDSYLKHSIENGEILVSGDQLLDRQSIALLTKSNKIVEFQNGSFSFIDTEDQLWKSGMDILTYASRPFIYLLSPQENDIWRYERTSKQYRQATSSNADKIDIKDAVSFAIDGNMYVLKKDGSVKRFYARKEMTFSIDGGPSIPLKDLDQRAKIFTNENLRNIYILDPGHQRVLMYKKVSFESPDKMAYEKQFVFEGLDLRDFYVDNNEQFMYILTPQKILKVEL